MPRIYAYSHRDKHLKACYDHTSFNESAIPIRNNLCQGVSTSYFYTPGVKRWECFMCLATRKHAVERFQCIIMLDTTILII